MAFGFEKPSRLIQERFSKDADDEDMPITLDGILRWYAYDIETSLIEAGAIKDDYTLLDLYQLAQPFALAEWNKEQVSIVRTI